MASPLKIFVITIEQSAEAILKDLLTQITTFFPDAYIEGVTSKNFSFPNFHPFIDTDRLKIMGLVDVIWALPRILKTQKQIKQRLIEEPFDLVLTIDASSFHLPLVRDLKKAGVQARFVHAVCPPIWAYRPKRKTKIAATFDLLLPLFAFEAPLFDDTSLKTFWIGHPFKDYQPIIPKNPTHIGLFPGSRKRVIERNLPLQLEAAAQFNLPIYISIASAELAPLIHKLAPNIPTYERLPPQEILAKTRLAIATSGTITLELALFNIPVVVTYKLPLIDAIAAKCAKMHLTHFALPNILAKTPIFPELIHPFVQPYQLAEQIQKILANPPKIPLEELIDQIRPTYEPADLIKLILENTRFATAKE